MKVSSRLATVARWSEIASFSTVGQTLTVFQPFTMYGTKMLMYFTVLHFWGFTVVTNEVETAILSLPYIADVTVLPLEDEDERVAAIIKTKPSASPEGIKPNLEALRKDLTAKNGLMLFKQPTVAYWLGDDEEISLTVNGKVSKRDAKKKFFGEGWKSSQKVEILDLKTVEYWRMGGQC